MTAPAGLATLNEQIRALRGRLYELAALAERYWEEGQVELFLSTMAAAEAALAELQQQQRCWRQQLAALQLDGLTFRLAKGRYHDGSRYCSDSYTVYCRPLTSLELQALAQQTGKVWAQDGDGRLFFYLDPIYRGAGQADGQAVVEALRELFPQLGQLYEERRSAEARLRALLKAKAEV